VKDPSVLFSRLWQWTLGKEVKESISMQQHGIWYSDSGYRGAGDLARWWLGRLKYIKWHIGTTVLYLCSTSILKILIYLLLSTLGLQSYSSMILETSYSCKLYRTVSRLLFPETQTTCVPLRHCPVMRRHGAFSHEMLPAVLTD